MIGMALSAAAGFVFDTKLGKVIVAGVAAVALFTGWLWRHDAKIEARVETKIIERAKDAGVKANDEAEKVHTAAAKPGAAERLRKSSCRDCN